MYIIKLYDKKTGDIYESKTMVTSDYETACFVQEQYHKRNIGCVVKNTETGTEW